MPVTMLDPQGQAREIPDDQVQAAMQAGGKRAVKIADPQGTARWIPEEQKDAAIKAGGKIATQEKGFGQSFLDASGVSALTHIGDTIAGLPEGIKNEALRSYGELKKVLNHPMAEDSHVAYVVPFVGGIAKEEDEQLAQGNVKGALGTALGGAAGVIAPKVIPKAVSAGVRAVSPVAAEAAGRVTEAAGNLKNRIYPTSQSVAPAEAAARNLGKALVVPVQAMPNFIESATQEAGTIKAYAKANNLPINSTVDLAKAAEATAKSVQDHFNDQILAPNAKKVVSVPHDYRGEKLNVEGSRATLGEINSRINAINQELSPNYRKATQMQTNAASVSDADLIAEKRKLTHMLHDSLADATGLEPEEIASLRQQAGKLRTIADEVNLSANTNTSSEGRLDMGRSATTVGSKEGLIDRILQAVRGGPEVIGNRAVNKALKGVDPRDLRLPKPRLNPSEAGVSDPVVNQSSPQMVRPLRGEPLQEYIRRKKEALGQK